MRNQWQASRAIVLFLGLVGPPSEWAKRYAHAFDNYLDRRQSEMISLKAKSEHILCRFKKYRTAGARILATSPFVGILEILASTENTHTRTPATNHARHKDTTQRGIDRNGPSLELQPIGIAFHSDIDCIHTP